MQFALDENRNRVNAIDAIKGKEYSCPECGGCVIPKKGEIKVPHYAHYGCECSDRWNYDMSEWHMEKQEYFDEQYREVVCSDGKRTHRADILKDGVVLEFQHSPISAEEFNDRNNFYMSLGYRVVWVFDVEDQIDSGDLYFEETGSSRIQMRWKYPKQVLKCCPDLKEHDNKFALFLSWPHEDEEEDVIEKVVWSTKDEDDNPDFKRIILSNYFYCLKKNMDVSRLLVTRKDRIQLYLKKKPPYKIKKKGIKGYPRDAYICPRRPNEFGLKVFGETGCSYCKYCGALEETGKGKYSSNYNIYCCYPNQVNEETDPELGLYESNAPFF